MAVTPADVGSRVTLRRVVPEGVSDVVGELLSWADGVLSVRRRDGSVVAVAEASLVAARVVPPVRGPGGPPGAAPVSGPGGPPGAAPVRER
ncbi:MAG TPA: hypothetical protein VF519_06300 [Mycobacteriales bacterium]